jgi:hypothetical protein
VTLLERSIFIVEENAENHQVQEFMKMGIDKLRELDLLEEA